jgi:thioredoxin-like negative regulator of GroEL
MRGELAAGLSQRLAQLINEDPGNIETQAVLVRHVLLTDGIHAAMSKLEELSETLQHSSNDSELPLLRRIQTLNLVVALEQKTGRTEFLDALEGSAIEMAKQLAALNPNHERQLVRTLVRSGRIDDAISTLQRNSAPRESEQNRPELHAASLLELIRSAGSKREAVFPRVAQMMYSLVIQYPTNVELRLNYAELMLFARQYQFAEETLKPLENVAQQHGRIHSLRAWLRAVSGGDLNEAAALANSAVQTESQQPAFREVQARVLLSQNKPENALEILRHIAADQRSLAGQVYLVAALLKLDRESEARFEFDRLRPLSETDSLFPADEDLMKVTSEQILLPTTALR